MEQKQKKTTARQPYVIGGIAAGAIIVAAVIVIIAGMKLFRGSEMTEANNKLKNRAPMLGHIDTDHQALLVDRNGKKISLDGQFSQCIMTADRQHIIAQDTKGGLHVYDGSGNYLKKLTDDGTTIDEGFVSDDLVVYYKTSDRTLQQAEPASDMELRCYIYSEDRQVELGMCSMGSFIVEDDTVLFAGNGDVFYFDNSMTAPEKIKAGKDTDFIEFMGISQDSKIAVWYVLEGQERNVYCYQDREVQLLDSVNNKAFGEPGYVLFFNEGESAAVYGNSYNKVVIKDGSGEPWEASFDGTLQVSGVVENEHGWQLYCLAGKTQKMSLYCISQDGQKALLKENVMSVVGCQPDGIYFVDNENTLFRGILADVSEKSDSFETEALAQHVTEAIYMTGSGNGLLMFQYAQSEGAAANRVSYANTNDFKAVPVTDGIYMFAFAPDDSGFYYIDREASESGEELLVLYYQDFNGHAPVEIDQNIFLIDTGTDQYIQGQPVIYFKQVLGENPEDYHIEMYTYYNGEKNRISDSVVY